MLRKYSTLLKANWALSLEYRAAIVIWMLYGFLPLIPLAVWLSATGPGQALGGFTSADFISYYLALIIVRQSTGVWVGYELDRQIRQGELSPKLLRPLNPIHHEISAHLAEKMLRLPITLLLIMPLMLLLNGTPYDLNLLTLLAFLGTIIGAWMIVFLSNYAIGLLAFWLSHVTSILELWHGTRMLLGGSLAPIALLPTVVREASPYLPMRYTMSFPVEILMGRVSGEELLLGAVVMLSWICCFGALAQLAWRRGLKRYGAVGA